MSRKQTGVLFGAIVSASAAVAVVIALLVVVGLGHIGKTQAINPPGTGAVVVGFDMDPSAAPANTATSIGTVEACISVANVAGTTFDVDSFVDAVPAVETLVGFSYFMSDTTGTAIAPGGPLTLTAQNHWLLLAATAGSGPQISLSEAVPEPPDSRGNPGIHSVSEADLGVSEPGGSVGELGKYTFMVNGGAVPGIYGLTMTGLAFAGSGANPDWTFKITDVLDANYSGPAGAHGLIALGVPCPLPADLVKEDLQMRPFYGDKPPFTKFPDMADDDGDTVWDEDPKDGIDNDGDLLVDEDPFGFLGIDNDGDTFVDEDGAGRIDFNGDTYIEPSPNCVMVQYHPPAGPTLCMYEDQLQGRDDDGDGLVDEDPLDADVSVQTHYILKEWLFNNGPEPMVDAWDVKEIDAPETPYPEEEDGCGHNTCTDGIDNGPACDGAGGDGADGADPDCDGHGSEVSAHILDPTEIITVPDGVPIYIKPQCVPPKVPAAVPVGPYEGDVFGLGGLPGDCVVVDSVPGVIKELDVHKNVWLPIGEPVLVEEQFDLHCHGPSLHKFLIQNEVYAKSQYIPDPNPANNALAMELAVNCIGQADLKKVSLSAIGVPPQIAVSEEVWFQLEHVLHNNGPQSPVHAWKVTRAWPPPGGTVSYHCQGGEIITRNDIVIDPNCPFSTVYYASWPDFLDVHVNVELPLSLDFVEVDDWDLHCLEPSTHTWHFENEVYAKDPHIVDPVPGNNSLSLDITVDCIAQADLEKMDLQVKPFYCGDGDKDGDEATGLHVMPGTGTCCDNVDNDANTTTDGQDPKCWPFINEDGAPWGVDDDLDTLFDEDPPTYAAGQTCPWNGDDDCDGVIDEDPKNNLNDDPASDVLVDEDPAVGFLGWDNDKDGLVDEDGAGRFDFNGNTVIDACVGTAPYRFCEEQLQGVDDDGDTLVDEDPLDIVVSEQPHYLVKELLQNLGPAGPVHAWDIKEIDAPAWRVDALEDGLTTCNDGLDNDMDGMCDTVANACWPGSLPDPECLDPHIGEEAAGLHSCNDELDNGADSWIDELDSDCYTLTEVSVHIEDPDEIITVPASPIPPGVPIYIKRVDPVHGNKCQPPKEPIGYGPYEGSAGGLAMEDGSLPAFPGAGDCNDGSDNDLDTLVDGADPDCHICVAVDSVPGVFKELDVHKNVELPGPIPPVGAPETGTDCGNGIDDDGDTVVDDGCPVPVWNIQQFDLHCHDPSLHKFIIQNRLEPKDPHVVDPNPNNNELATEMLVACVSGGDLYKKDLQVKPLYCGDSDKNGMEDGSGPVAVGTGDCCDNVDNDGDTFTDGLDPQCQPWINDDLPGDHILDPMADEDWGPPWNGDDDADTVVDEDPKDNVDNDGDTLVDEDPAEGFLAFDNDGDTLPDEDGAGDFDWDGDTEIDDVQLQGVDDDGDTQVDEDPLDTFVSQQPFYLVKELLANRGPYPSMPAWDIKEIDAPAWRVDALEDGLTTCNDGLDNDIDGACDTVANACWPGSLPDPQCLDPHIGEEAAGLHSCNDELDNGGLGDGIDELDSDCYTLTEVSVHIEDPAEIITVPAGVPIYIKLRDPAHGNKCQPPKTYLGDGPYAGPAGGLAMEDGSLPAFPGAGDCNDGINNDADTLVDGADPDCHVCVAVDSVPGVVKELDVHKNVHLPYRNYKMELISPPPAPPDPRSSHWHEIEPVFSQEWHLISWHDNDGNGELSVSDQIDMELFDPPTGEVKWFHVEEIDPATGEMWLTEEMWNVQQFDLHCDYPGLHKFIIQNRLEPKDPHLLDPYPGNNELETEMLVECAPLPEPHYKCYEIFGPAPPGPPMVNLTTQFGEELDVDVGPPVLLCPPALKNDQGNLNAPHLKCYDIFEPPPGYVVNLTDQFGLEEQVWVGPAEELCVPALKDAPPPVPPVPTAPHYKCYDIVGHDPPDIVNLKTQFGLEPDVDVGPAIRLCAPALKNGQGDLNAPHLKCYDIVGEPPPGPPLVILQTQFGLEKVDVGPPRRLCVPVVKEIVPIQDLTFSLARVGAQTPAPIDPADLVIRPPAVVWPCGVGGFNLLNCGGTDDVNAVSLGQDFILPPPDPNNANAYLYFSVAPGSVGVAGTGVNDETVGCGAPGPEPEADEFGSAAAGSNYQYLDGDGVASCTNPPAPPLGLLEPPVASPGPGDDLDAIDPLNQGGTQFPILGSLEAASLSISGAGMPTSAADIFIDTGSGIALGGLYAAAPALGLDGFGANTDDIDALCILDGDGVWDYNPAADTVWFSLTEGSASLGVNSPADVFAAPFTGTPVVTAAQLGLFGAPPGVPGDELNALKCYKKPPQPHYKCYDIVGDIVPPPVTLETQFGLEPLVPVGPATLLCPPALKNGQGDLNAPHLVCHDIIGDDPPDVVNLFTQFPDEYAVEVGPAQELCVPALKDAPTPPPPLPEAPHYKCYEISGPPVNVLVTLQTQFGIEPHVFVYEPIRLCAPALKTIPPGPPQGDLTEPHLKCYAIVGDPPPGPPIVNLITQFGSEDVPVGPPRRLCVPVEKEVVPLQPHYKWYEITGPPLGEIVSLVTQFGTETDIMVNEPVALLPPALKNGQGNLNEPHLKCYAIFEPPPGYVVNLTDQFGVEQNVPVGPAEELCMPVAKEVIFPEPVPPGSLPDTPHYKCYEISGPPVNVLVTLQTQFGIEPHVFVYEPIRLCAPALKTWAGQPPQGDLNAPHLKCYNIAPLPPPGYMVNLQTQFGFEFDVPVGPPIRLCVPALKEVVPPSADSKVLDVYHDDLGNDLDPVTPELDIYKSSNITIDVYSVEHNNGPFDADSEITFLADIPLGCEGQWLNETDTMRPYDPLDPMDQGVGVGPTPGKDPGDGILGTAESVTEAVYLEPVSVPIVAVEPFELHCWEDGLFTFTLCNKQEVLSPGVDPDLTNNWACFDLTVNSMPNADKQVTDIVFDYANAYPMCQGTELPIHPAKGLPAFEVEASSNVALSVKSIEYNAGPQEPPDSQVNFYADIPAGCEGQWVTDTTFWPYDTRSVWGDPYAPPHSAEQKGFDDLDPNKEPGDGIPGTFESDLHFQTADYGIEEPVGEEVEILRFFELHCWDPGQYHFTFCNKIEPKPPYEDPDLGNNLRCEDMVVEAIPAGDEVDKQVVDIDFDEGDQYPSPGASLPWHPYLTPPGQTFSAKVSHNVKLSVSSIEFNAGPNQPDDVEVSFYADIPLDCEGRWVPDPGTFPFDIHTRYGDPNLGSSGTQVLPDTPKEPGDGNPATFEADLHLQTADYGIVEPVGVPLPILRFFELHCDPEGMYPFVFCNRADVKPPEWDPVPGNELWCETLWVLTPHAPGCPNSDADTWDDCLEAYMGTDYLDDCPDDPTHDAWPPDIDMDMDADIVDVLKFKPAILSHQGEPRYNKRLDFDGDGDIDIVDVLKYKPIILTQCTNP